MVKYHSECAEEYKKHKKNGNTAEAQKYVEKMRDSENMITWNLHRFLPTTN